MERQRVGISRAVSRKMRIPKSNMCSADYFATVNVENITDTCARCVVAVVYAVCEECASPPCHLLSRFVAGACSGIGMWRRQAAAPFHGLRRAT